MSLVTLSYTPWYRVCYCQCYPEGGGGTRGGVGMGWVGTWWGGYRYRGGYLAYPSQTQPISPSSAQPSLALPCPA